MKRIALLKSVITFTVLSTFILVGGCKSTGGNDEMVKCPTCNRQTVTTPIKGLKYTRHVCPSCKTVSTTTVNYDELGDITEELHACTYCEANLITCPQCRGQ